MLSLELQHVSKSFGGVHAVADVTLSVPQGKVTGLIGPNGAGKSTVVNLVTGMLKLTGGEIRMNGESIGEATAQQVVRKGVARTFQNIRLLLEATVLENVLIGFHRHEKASILSGILGLSASRRESADMRRRAMVLLKRFNMTRYADYPAGSLAYGHQRRVEMMRAVASDPHVLLLDEPVAGMNDVEANELGAIFLELVAGGMGVLLIEHNIRFVNRLCDHVYVLDTGRMIADGTPSAVMSDPTVVKAYLGGV